jgi:hypothetical protein
VLISGVPSTTDRVSLRYTLSVAERELRLFGEDEEPDPVSIGLSDLERRTLDVLIGMLRKGRLDDQGARLLGEYLYRMLLNNNVGELLHRKLRGADNPCLRVDLRFEDPKSSLHDLPWEYLYRREASGAGYFLAMEPRLALVRCPKLVNPPRQLVVPASEKPVKVLVVACSPADQQPLEFDGFVETIKSLGDVDVRLLATRYSNDPGFSVARDGDPEATLNRFKNELSDFQPHVVHFLGHGSGLAGGIAFVDESYHTDWCAAAKLWNILKEHPSVRLAFLQACETSLADVSHHAMASVAGALLQTGIPAIVAMQAKIEIGEASAFAGRFYGEVVKKRRPIFLAMQLAREDTNQEAACIPVLYLQLDKTDKEALLLIDDRPAAPTVTQTTPIAATGVPAAEALCPWCYEPLAPEQVDASVCPNCASDLRCPNPECNQPIRSKIAAGKPFVYCTARRGSTACRTKIFRFVERDEGARPTSDGFIGSSSRQVDPQWTQVGPGVDFNRPA